MARTAAGEPYCRCNSTEGFCLLQICRVESQQGRRASGRQGHFSNPAFFSSALPRFPRSARFGIRFTSPWRRRSRPSRGRTFDEELRGSARRAPGSEGRRRSSARSASAPSKSAREIRVEGLLVASDDRRRGQRRRLGGRGARRSRRPLRFPFDGDAIEAAEAEAIARVPLDRSAHQDGRRRIACRGPRGGTRGSRRRPSP